MSIIKQIMVDIEEARMKEIAQEDQFAQAELVARQLGLAPVELKPEELSENADEVARIVSYYRSHGGLEMADGDLRKAVSNDFEQLEFSPEEVAALTARAVKAIKRR